MDALSDGEAPEYEGDSMPVASGPAARRAAVGSTRASSPPEKTSRHLPERVECIAYRVAADRYRAICLDFSLVAESDTSALDAQERLVRQIRDYVAEIVAEGYPPHLVNRRLSRRDALQLRALVAWQGFLGLLASLLPGGHAHAGRADWEEPLPSVA